MPKTKINNNELPTEIQCVDAGCSVDFANLEAAADGNARKVPTVEIAKVYSGGLIRVAGFWLPVVLDLKGISKRRNVSFLKDHLRSKVVGQAKKVVIDTSTISAFGILTGEIDEPNNPTREIIAHARDGFIWPVSVGVNEITKIEEIKDGSSVIVNGKAIKGPAYIIRKGVLQEISFVGVGADGKATGKVAASAAEKENEMPKETPETVEANAPETIVTPTPAAVPAPAEPTQAELTASAEVAELTRVNGINATADKYRGKIDKIDELKASAVSEKHSVDVFKTSLLDSINASAPASPGVHIGSSDKTQGMFEAAVMASADIPEDDIVKSLGEQTVEASAKHFGRGGIGLQELMLEAAAVNGMQGKQYRISDHNLSEVTGYLSRARVQAAASTIDISGVLGNTANKRMVMSYEGIPSVWRDIADVGRVSDFKTVTDYRVGGLGMLADVGPDGQLQHATMGEESYTINAGTKGLMLAITRTDMINDDLGVFLQNARRFGVAAARKLNHDFWTAFMVNTSFFTDVRANLLHGTANVLSVTGLTAAKLMFAKITDLDGEPTGTTADRIAVPLELGITAAQLNKDVDYRDTTASTKYIPRNPHTSKYTPIEVPQLSNSSYTGYSETAWYMFANPSSGSAAMRVVFLNGVQAPTIQTSDADFSVLGTEMRAYFDYGVKLYDYRAAVKVTGIADPS